LSRGCACQSKLDHADAAGGNVHADGEELRWAATWKEHG
jgi:hypothetical protein